MKRRHLYEAFLLIVSGLTLAVGGFSQGHGHGGGNPHSSGGGDHHGNGGGNPHGEEHGGGPPQRQWQPERQDHRGGNPHGNGEVWAQQRALEQQQRAAQQQQWQQQRALQQQQRQNEWNARRQQQSNQQAWRQQQEALRQQYRQQYVPAQPQWDRHDNGRHNGWTDNGPRGNAYGLRGVAPAQERAYGNWNPWQAQAWQQRRDERRDDRDRDRYRDRRLVYYDYDPVAVWAPQVYRSYTTYNGYNYPSYHTYSQPRDTFLRTVISSFFVPQNEYYTTFYEPPYYSSGYSNQYAQYVPGYYYSNAGYAPGYSYDSGYYDPYQYGGVPMFASPFYGDNSLKSSLISFGFQMLQGFLGQGYQQGLSDAEYVRAVEGPVYYDPYQAPEQAYYSPYVSSFADQRQIFEQGYRLGYEDAMRNQDPYGAYGSNTRVDLVSQFLANSLLGS